MSAFFDDNINNSWDSEEWKEGACPEASRWFMEVGKSPLQQLDLLFGIGIDDIDILIGNAD